MESEPQHEADFIKGFNDGYLIAKHAPVLSERLSKIESGIPHIEGIQEGIDQYMLEQLRNIRTQSREQDRDEREQDR